MAQLIKVNAKALLLLALIVLAGIADALGIGLGLDIEHYIALLVADGFVWAVPNEDPERTT